LVTLVASKARGPRIESATFIRLIVNANIARKGDNKEDAGNTQLLQNQQLRIWTRCVCRTDRQTVDDRGVYSVIRLGYLLSFRQLSWLICALLFGLNRVIFRVC